MAKAPDHSPLQAIFGKTSMPHAQDIAPGLTPRMKAVQLQKVWEDYTCRAWPRRRFETPRTEELARLNRLLSVDPAAALALHIANRLMLVVEIRQEGACWVSRATLWEAPSEEAYMRADDGQPAPDDAALLARGWRRAGGCPVAQSERPDASAGPLKTSDKD